MATKDKKLSAEQIAALKKEGIKGVSTVEEARAAMIAFLEKNDLDGCENDTFDDLLEMTHSIYEGSEEANDDLADEEDEEEEDEDDDSDEDEDEEEEDDDEDSDDEEEDEDEDSDDEEEEDEEEEEKPAKKSSKKEKEAPAKKAKEVEKKNDKTQKTAVAKAKKDTTEKVKKTAEPRGTKRLDPIKNEEDAKKYDPLKKILGKDFEYNFIANGGVSVKYLGKNNKKVFLSFDSPKVTKDGIVGRVYLSSVRDEEVLTDLFGDGFTIKKSWSGNMLVMDISLEELVAAIKANREGFDAVIKKLEGKDEKLGKNREKMEKDLKSSNKGKAEEVKAKKKTKPAPEPEDDEDEEEEEEEAPKTKKKVKSKPEPEVEAAPVKKKKKK